MKIYIAGPMTGLPEHKHPAFDQCVLELRRAGYEVLNRPEFALEPGVLWEKYMKEALALMLTCEAVYLLRGWQLSRGARLAHHLAIALGLQIITGSPAKTQRVSIEQRQIKSAYGIDAAAGHIAGTATDETLPINAVAACAASGRLAHPASNNISLGRIIGIVRLGEKEKPKVIPDLRKDLDSATLSELEQFVSREFRLATEGTVNLRLLPDGDKTLGTVVNLSEHGCCLLLGAAAPEAEVGKNAELVLCVRKETVILAGVIRRRREKVKVSKRLATELGLEFTHVSARKAEQVEILMDELS